MIQIVFTVEVRESRRFISFKKASRKTGKATSTRTKEISTIKPLGSINSTNRKGTIKEGNGPTKADTLGNSRSPLKNQETISKTKNIQKELKVNMKGD